MRLKQCLLTALAAAGVSMVQAQQHTLLQPIRNTVNKAAEHYPQLVLQPDSVAQNGNLLQVYFNVRQSFTVRQLPDALVEDLNEALAHMAYEAGADNIVLLAKDAVTNTWKTLDYFTPVATKVRYQPQPNNDPFPDVKGTVNSNVAARLFPTPSQSAFTGGLLGKTVWLSPGHGWNVANSSASAFSTQRGTTNEVVEDFGTIETINYYLLNYLYNAGANVWSVRERDVNTNEIIVNNDAGAPQYTETGNWTDGGVPGYNGTYRVANSSATATATATFTPNITVSGYYWVSVQFVSGLNRPTDVKYTVHHAGGTTTYTVNQEVHGSTWVYIGRFYFAAGGDNKVVLSNQSTQDAQAIIADAVRFGGGIGQQADCNFPSVSPNGSNKARFEEAANMYARYQGYPTCVGDVNMRPLYAEWEANKGGIEEVRNSVFVSFHTNAANATARGTETYRYNGLGSGRPNISPGSTQLRDSIHRQIVSDIRAGYNPSWTDRGVKEANFGELRNLDSIPGTLIELAFHDTPADATDLKNAEFRRLAARAIYKGIVKYFNYKDGTPIVFLPEEPTHFLAKNIGNNQVQLTWRRPATGGIFGHPATSYRVYISNNGKGFGDGLTVNDTTYTFTGAANTTYYFKVSAVNAGGESFTTSVVAARTPATSTGVASYLIVDGFDRLSPMVLRNEGGVLGNVRRMFLERMNRYDYMVDHAAALSNCGAAFDGAQNEAVIADMITLNSYAAVDWILGEESTADRTLDATEAAKLTAYLDAGGNLLISGSEIGWDIGRAASANANLNFYNNYLKANYVDDDAGTYNFTGTSQFFANQSGSFDNGSAGIFDVDFPDRISAVTGAELLLNYSGGTGDGAAVGFRGTHRVVYMAFPFEAITDPAIRSTVMCNAVSYLTPLLPATGLTLKAQHSKGTNQLTWHTATEVNTQYFTIEKSDDGFNFKSMHTRVPAKGNSTTVTQYAASDMQVWPITYYRIKAVDKDGSFSYSNTVVVKADTKQHLFVVQNPVQSIVPVQVQSIKSFSLQLFTMAGTQVYQQAFSGGTQRLQIAVQHLPKGVYMLRFNDGTAQEQVKLVIQ